MSESSSLWRDALHRFSANRLAVLGFVIFVSIALFCFVFPLFATSRYSDQDLLHTMEGVSSSFWFGTDQLGRDLLVRICVGGQISISVGLLATAVSMLIGVLYGAVSGYIGGKIDSFMMRVVDVFYSMPYAIFVILLLSLFGSNIFLLFVGLGAVQWLTMARIVRGQTFALKKQEYVSAAITLGLPQWKILFSHIFPNLLGPVIVYSTLTIPAIMLLEAFLSFLGLGIQPPLPSWGTLIKEGAELMYQSPRPLILPSLFFSITLLSLNFIGDGLRDALDPESAKD